MNKSMNKCLEDVCEKILTNVPHIRKEIGGIPLFGAVGGSMSLNLANKSSDIDFYMVVKDEPGKTAGEHKKLCISDMVVDFMCIPLDELVRECEKYSGEERRYPTIFYRSESEKDKIRLNKDAERPDFKREVVGRIYLSDKILEFEPGAVRKNYGKLNKGCRLIDLWDYHFNRAFGNYHEKIVGKEKVLLRKYLYTVSEITICQWLLVRNEKPVMDFKQMFTRPYCLYEDNEIIKICNELWEENRKTDMDKKEKFIFPVIYLNRWIEMQLTILLSEMQKKENYLKNSVLNI